MKKILLIFIILTIVISGIVFLYNKQEIATSINPTTKPVTVLPVVDVSAVAPHVITQADFNGTELKPELRKIEIEIKNLLIAKEPGSIEYYDYHILTLRAIGKKYALVTISTNGGGQTGLVVNLVSGDLKVIPEEYLATTNKGVIFIGYKKISYYKTDSSESVIVTGSELLDVNETYNSGGDMKATPIETHTDSSISIAIFDRNTIVQKADIADYRFKKLRTVTLTLPN